MCAIFRQQSAPGRSEEARPPVPLDLRTPRSTFNAFLRAVIQGQPERLWQTLDVDLQFLMKRQLHQEGADLFFERLRRMVSGRWGALRLGPPGQAGAGWVACPLVEARQTVGIACFRLHGCDWLLSSLS